MLPVQAEFLSPFRSILSAWCRQLVRQLRLVSVSLLPSTHLQSVLLCPLACSTHPAALLKINNSSLLSAPISSWPLPVVTHKVLSFPQKPPGFSWPLFYQRSQALQPHSLGDTVTMRCYSFQWTSLPEFSAKGSKSKGVSVMTEIPQMPCRVGLECFGEETLSTSPVCLLTETCPGCRSVGSLALEEEILPFLKRLELKNTLSVSRISWCLRICLLTI